MHTHGMVACMYIIHQLQHSCCIGGTFTIVQKLLSHAIIVQFLKKLYMVEYGCMYGVQINVQKTHFQLTCNYNKINYFYDVVIYLLIPCISKGIVAQQLYMSCFSYSSYRVVWFWPTQFFIMSTSRTYQHKFVQSSYSSLEVFCMDFT